MNAKIKPFYECEYCHKKLTTQARLDKHNCRQKERHLYLKTQKGKSAYFVYSSWMNEQGRKAPSISTFAESKYFNAIKEFVDYSNSVGLPDRQAFIKYVVERKILPFSWTDTELYNDFVVYFDESKTPEELCRISLTTILDLSEIFECDVSEVFDHMFTSDIMKLVIARKLSPWVLLVSQGFQNHIKFHTTAEQKIMINTVIDHKHWVEKIKQNPESVKKIRSIVNEFKI